MATELAKAYVQIVPSAQGIQSKIETAMGGDMLSAGQTLGNSLGNTIGSFMQKALIALGIGDMIKQAIDEGGALEQSIGGIETLFGESSDAIREYAQQAYETAGLSANEYMQTATGFAASLLQGLGGDTQAAAEITDMAIRDMSDNANKMGTDMESIQIAYQGFAKQNYTMLDNLKLGYGGTKEEMARLLADAQALTGVEYDMDNLSDVYNAIHAVQEELGITGTTAAEASDTISGSTAAVKAAWQNLLGDLTLGNDISGDIEALVDTVLAAADNLLPAVVNIISKAPEAILSIAKELVPALLNAGVEAVSGLATGFAESLPALIDMALEVVFTIVDTIIGNIDTIITAGLQLVMGLVTGLLQALPELIAKVPIIIQSILTTLLGFIPDVIEAGLGLFTSLVENLPQIISDIINIIPVIIDAVIDTIVKLIPMIIETGVQLITSLVTALPEIIKAIVAVLPTIINSIIDAVVDLLPMIEDTGVLLFTSLIKLFPQILESLVGCVYELIAGIINTFISTKDKFVEVGPKLIGYIKDSFESSAVGQIGKHLIDGLLAGIRAAWSNLKNSVRNLCNELLSSIKSAFGIHSPSRVFRDEIGKMLDYGLAEGIEGNTDVVTDAMDELQKASSMDTDINMTSQQITELRTEQMCDELEKVLNLLGTYLPGLANMAIMLDKETLVGELTPAVDEELGLRYIKAMRGVVT